MTRVPGDGGPAFPSTQYKTERPLYIADQLVEMPMNGMSLRDWFAGMALQGQLAHGRMWEGTQQADECYKYADAMIAEREKGRDNG